MRYLLVNKNESLIHSSKWMDMKHTIIMKVVRPQRLYTICFHLYGLLEKEN